MIKQIKFTAAVLGLGAIVAFGRISKAQDAPAAPVLSEDFESGQIDKNIWDVRVSGDPTIKVQQDNTAHGKYALQIHFPAGKSGRYAFIVATHLPDSVRQHFFGRAYMFAGPNPPNAHDVAILAGTPGFPVSNFLELGLHDNHLQPSFQENGAGVPRGETVPPRTQTYPVGKWFLMEWEFNDNPDHMNVWIDGQQVVDQTFTYKTQGNSNLVKGFSDFAFGYRVWGSGPKTDFDIYYDDIAIGTSRLGPVAGPVNESKPTTVPADAAK
jgi:hypothetical protein